MQKTMSVWTDNKLIKSKNDDVTTVKKFITNCVSMNKKWEKMNQVYKGKYKGELERNCKSTVKYYLNSDENL